VLLISDANVLIDMAAGELLEAMFELPEAFATPDLLFHQELSSRHPQLPKMGLRLLTLKSDGVQEVQRLHTHCKGRTAPGLYDLFALVLAEQEQCPLLTGDRRLRALANERYPTLEIRGTLWLVEQLVTQGHISLTCAQKAYDRMISDGSRLPLQDIKTQLVRLAAIS